MMILFKVLMLSYSSSGWLHMLLIVFGLKWTMPFTVRDAYVSWNSKKVNKTMSKICKNGPCNHFLVHLDGEKREMFIWVINFTLLLEGEIFG